jgi:hypothetical protein
MAKRRDLDPKLPRRVKDCRPALDCDWLTINCKFESHLFISTGRACNSKVEYRDTYLL